MAEVAEKLLTFDEFVDLNLKGCELVNGRLENLVAPRPLHGWIFWQFPILAGPQIKAIDPGCYVGAEVDIPTLPYHGRRPDFVYYSSAQRSGIDRRNNRVRGVPTLAIEVLSEEDERRDLVVKRLEYAQVGIHHYWILDPGRRTAMTLVLRDREYVVENQFSGDDHLTSSLFPGFSISLPELFLDEE